MEEKRTKSKGRRIAKAAGLIVLALLLIAVTAISVMSGYQVAYGLMHVNDGNPTGENSVLQLEEWGYDLAGFEAEYQPEYAELTASDGNKVPIWYFVTEGSKNTVILLHGLGGDHVCVYPLAEIYLEKGYNVITCDQRGTEKNGSMEITYGYTEKLDTQAIVDFAGETLESEKIVIHAQSLGGTNAVLYGGTEHAKENVDAIVLDSCLPAMDYAFLNAMELDGFMGDYLVFCGDIYLKLWKHFGFKDTDMRRQAKNMEVDTLMLQMERDEVSPVELGQEIFENIGAIHKKICYFDSEHVEGVIDTPDAYAEAVFDFLGE